METKVEFGLIPIYAILAAPGVKALVSGLLFPLRHYTDFANNRRQAQANIDDKQIRVLSRLLVAIRQDVTPDILVGASALELAPKIRERLEEDAAYVPPLRELEGLGAARDRLVSLPNDAKRWALCKAAACAGYLAALSFLAFPYLLSSFHFSNKSKIIALVITTATGSFAVAFFLLEVLMGRRMIRILNEHD